MGWKGTLRSVNAAIRAAERDAARRHKANLKAQMIEDALVAVEDWQEYIKGLTSLHVNLPQAVDWLSIANSEKPVEPEYANVFEQKAMDALRRFKPSVFDFLRGGTKKRRLSLEQAIESSKAKDKEKYDHAFADYHLKLEDWVNETALARRLTDGEASAIREVIAEMQTLSKDADVGTSIDFSIKDNFVHAMPTVHSEEIVPDFRRKQLASGRLSETKMPKGDFNDLYQDYVASVALRVAGDLLQILPIEEVYVTCLVEMLNPATGHLENTPILSVQFVRRTFENLNLARIDPSDSLANFNHVMNFKRAKGFAAIEPLESTNLEKD